MKKTIKPLFLALVCLVASTSPHASAQVAPQAPAAGAASSSAPDAPPALPSGYVIGAEDVLSIVFWRDKDMSADVRVRPDGRISLPLLNEVAAAGLTPDELRAKLTQAASKFVQEPSATVIVKEINSRNVFITGNVSKPGTFALKSDMNVLQLIALAGGLLEYADSKHIVIIRTEKGTQKHLPFNYNDVVRQKRTEQNIQLKPGDTVIVP